jgi:hypothetical protein
LRKPDVWLDQSGEYGHDEDMEDARDLLGVIQRLCRAARNKGKGRAASVA